MNSVFKYVLQFRTLSCPFTKIKCHWLLPFVNSTSQHKDEGMRLTTMASPKPYASVSEELSDVQVLDSNEPLVTASSSAPSSSSARVMDSIEPLSHVDLEEKIFSKLGIHGAMYPVCGGREVSFQLRNVRLPPQGNCHLLKKLGKLGNLDAERATAGPNQSPVQLEPVHSYASSDMLAHQLNLVLPPSTRWLGAFFLALNSNDAKLQVLVDSPDYNDVNI
ncbi:hypothetical protein MSG28_010459 [Choristoneura fumiferana]|uniref:Uncharacterized protein n=1 Tax=Choristoneura fumiferana TaxID=7141 RepID=A0ACC0KLC7_CHOFU|nr:hypothetical protein MSG28_010459 [Choristoneura fumiferana]